MLHWYRRACVLLCNTCRRSHSSDRLGAISPRSKKQMLLIAAIFMGKCASRVHQHRVYLCCQWRDKKFVEMTTIKCKPAHTHTHRHGFKNQNSTWKFRFRCCLTLGLCTLNGAVCAVWHRWWCHYRRCGVAVAKHQENQGKKRESAFHSPSDN